MNSSRPSSAGGLVGKEGADLGSGLRSVVHLSLPKDGKFSVVVVGSSAADDYPESANTWKGRLAYTVYLHIGTTKNWILQYSLPRSPEAVQAGSTARPEAPWPYDITRPTIDANTGADAIIIHGYVDATGHFERLAVVFPSELAESRFLLHALQLHPSPLLHALRVQFLRLTLLLLLLPVHQLLSPLTLNHGRLSLGHLLPLLQ